MEWVLIFTVFSAVHDLSIKADSYNMAGKQINGMDVLEVYEETLEFVEQARSKRLPAFLEIKTFRYKGHSMSDPAKYRTRDELQQYRELDPIVILKKRMADAQILTEQNYKELDRQCREIAARAAEFAEKSPEPPLASLYQDVLA